MTVVCSVSKVHTQHAHDGMFMWKQIKNTAKCYCILLLISLSSFVSSVVFLCYIVETT
jgi:hypothetical protein